MKYGFRDLPKKDVDDLGKKLKIIWHSHLDPQWARCYDRQTLHNGYLHHSYADLWEWIMDRYLDLEAHAGMHYSEGQHLVLRTYLNRHPEKRERIEQLIRDGRIEILLQGELTPETNYSPAEGLARNYLLAEPFYDRVCAKDSPGRKIAWLWDAFGNSANMPQVVKLAGAECIGGLKYRYVDEDYWVGIDGTKLPCLDRIGKFIWWNDGNAYYITARHTHCRQCAGRGCDDCGQRGMVEEHPYPMDEVIAFLHKMIGRPEETVYALIGGEEVLPSRVITDAVDRVRQERPDVEITYANVGDFWTEKKEYYLSVADQHQQITCDLNPVHQGCYVSRIENKQRTRATAYALCRAEAFLAGKIYRGEEVSIPQEELDQAWRNVLLNMHHDSISGAHTDSGQQELMDYLDEADAIADGILPIPKQKICKRLPDGRRHVEGIGRKTLGEIEVEYDLRGIRSALTDGQDVFGKFRFENITWIRNHSDQVRIGELMLQTDYGDNHSTLYLGDPLLLGKYNYVVYDMGDCLWWRGKYDGTDPSVKKLSWEIFVRPSADGKRLSFRIEVDWDTYDRRLRAIIPVDDHGLVSTWEIPYAHIDRAFDPETIRPTRPESKYTMPLGEYPALHWMKHAIDGEKGVAVLNRGLPSLKWMPGRIEISLLRSPQMCGDTVIPSIEEIWDCDGTRDTGKHCLEFEVWPYVHGIGKGELTRAGYAYNLCDLSVPFHWEGDVVITAFKPAHDGKGCILRLQEAGGKDGIFSLRFDKKRKITEVNLVEKPLNEPVETERMKIPLHKHQIYTLRIE